MRVSTVQMVMHVEPAVHARMAELAPWLRRVQVLQVEDESVLALAKSYEAHVDALLLDSGHPAASEFGGTGRVHDWALSAKVVQASRCFAERCTGLLAGLLMQRVRVELSRRSSRSLRRCGFPRRLRARARRP